MDTKGFFALLGVGTPSLIAAATFGLFAWLDLNASNQATRVISTLLKGRPYERIDMRRAIIAAVDCIYTSPLWRPRALLRSAIFSTALFTVFTVYYISAHLNLFMNSFIEWWPFLISVVLSDYISLFVVRNYLTRSSGNLITSLFLALLYGLLVVFWAYRVGVVLVVNGLDYYTRFLIAANIFDMSVISDADVNRIMNNWGLFFAPALLVHLWFLLFAAGALGVRLLYPIFRAVESAQWFLKNGEQHPLRAIGMVAAVLVFGVGTIWKLIFG